jgi:hypothetical protein
MALIEDYRDQADQCRRLAEAEEDEADRSVWLLLQNAWMRLSDEAPKILKADAGAAKAASVQKSRGKRRG